MDEGLGGRLMKQLKEVGELAGIKTEEYARISKKKLDVLSLDREIVKEKTALGERVLELADRGETRDVLGDITVQAIRTRIRTLNASLAECEREIDTIRDAAHSRTKDVRRRYQDERDVSPRGEADPASSRDEPEPRAAEPGDKPRGEI
jgi:hypothetical protein